MTWQTFCQKHRLTLSDDAKQLCAEAWSLMSRSVDPLHEVSHLVRLIDDLHHWLLAQPSLKKEVNWSVLMTALCWHDVWKAQNLAITPLKIAWAQWYEGIGSVQLLTKAARAIGADHSFVKQVKYTIRKHSLVQFLKHETTEAQILWDIDALDLWNDQRLKTLKKLLSQKAKNRQSSFIHVVNLYLWLHRPQMIYYDWPRGEFIQRRTQYLNKIRST